MKGDVFTHAEAYSVCRGTELVAVVDGDAVALNSCGDRWTISQRFTSVDELLRSGRVDIVSVATPTDSHAAIVKQLLDHDNRPRAIICEKPIATDIQQGEEIVRLAREKNVLLAVMFMRRYATNMRNLRKFISEGGIGDVRGISGWNVKGAIHNGVHWFDLMRYLTGLEVRYVSGLNMLREESDDPTLEVAMFLGNGMLAVMRAAEHANFTLCEMDIMGTKGRVRIVDSSYVVEVTQAAPSQRYSGYTELAPIPVDMGDRRNTMLHAVEDIVECLDTGKEPESTGEDGLAALRIALAAQRSSLMNGTVVEVE
jgi:UDP-N-acetylglucosamine 3-dehydrogenase